MGMLPRKAASPPTPHERARAGDFERALPLLLRSASAGNGQDAAAAAELLAYLHRWDEAASHAKQFLANPAVAYAGNVFTDMCSIVYRASVATGNFALINDVAKVIPEKYAARTRACLTGARPAALQPKPVANAKSRATYQEAVDKAVSGERFVGAPEALARHVYALADVFRVEDELESQWPQVKHLLSFEQSIAAARAVSRRIDANENEAWAIIHWAIPRWTPVESLQIAPVLLLSDPHISPLMTPARCRKVLATARGPQAKPH